MLMDRTGLLNSYMRVITFSFMLVALSLGAMVSSLQAQSFEHEKHPRLDFDFQSLALDLGVQPQNLRIDGAAEYKVRANISGADTLTLQASHIDISSVTVNNESADFSLHNDALYIPVDDSSEAGESYTVNIRYSGRSQFGLLRNYKGTVWTSQLPRAQRHWVPVVDNPHVTFKTKLNISVPSGNQVWATGQKTGEEVVSVDVVTFKFASEKEVPASGLAFSIGKFDHQSTDMGSTQVNVAVEQVLADSVDSQQILDSTRGYVKKISSRLEMEYPYSGLNIIVLKDHSWETKSWGANTVFVYMNRGPVQAQLLRGIIGQWFGIYQREAQWSQADAVTLYQTLLMEELADGPVKLESKDEPQISFSTIYDNFGPEEWNRWQESIGNWQNPSVRSFISNSVAQILKNGPGVISWQDYADYWYRKIGQPLYDMPQFLLKKGRTADQPSDSVIYEVYYTLNEAEGKLKLRFSSKQGVFKELTTLRAIEVYTNKTDQSEVTFTGAEDSVILQVDPTISNLKLSNAGHPELILDEYKPAPFLLHQMRNGETVEERAAAARKLGYHSKNPDLQLAIRDFMSRDLEPEVRAALLHSLADITDGAAGTEQTFLDALGSENKKIRNAGLMALQNYKGNSSVLNRVESLAQNTQQLSFFKKATKVLMTIASEEQFKSFVKSVAQQDTVGKRSIFAIQELANMGNVEEAIERANLFTGEQYRYDIRSRALKILIQYNHTPADWIARAEDLLKDADPRLRFLTVRGMERNKNKAVVSFLKEHIQDEYDARVHKKIEQLIKGQ